MLPGPTELIIIFAVLLLLFGSTKLPKLGGAIGEAIKNFRKGVSNDDKNLESKDQKEDAKH